MRSRQKVSRAGVELIKSFEGLRQTATRLPDGRWTLGYGHTFSAREGARVTSEDADALLRFDLLPIVDSLNNMILVPLNQNQFDSLVSFAFNIGIDNFAQSTVLKRLNEGRMGDAAAAMDSWRSAEFNGQTYVLAPLIRRRAAEKNLFMTPEEVSASGSTLGMRPVEDAPADAVPVEHIPGAPEAPPPAYSQQAYSPPPHAPQASADLSYLNPYAAPTPAPVPAPREVIDLSQFAPKPYEPRPYEAPAAPVPPPAAPQVVESLPTTPPSYTYGAVEPQMSPEVQANLARAQEEQRLREDAQRQAQMQVQAQMAAEAAARAAEEARLQEFQRQEALRQEQARLEAARLEAERLERERQEAQRLEYERQEAQRQEIQRQEALRLEAERQEREREQLRLEAERAERERAEQARQEQARQEQLRLDREREDAERQRAAAAAVKPVDDEAEKARKADAAAALMRLYSPYGGGTLGKPLAGGLGAPLNPPAPVVPSTPVTPAQAAPEAVMSPVAAPITPAPPAPGEFSNHSVIAPQAAEAAPFVLSARSEPASPEPAKPESGPTIRGFGAVDTASTMPPPSVVVLNPYARPIPAATDVVEVPRPAPINPNAPSQQPQVQPSSQFGAATDLNWREQLQRPLPPDYQTPAQSPSNTQTTGDSPSQGTFRLATAAQVDTAFDDDNEAWMMNGDRIALAAHDIDHDQPGWWQNFLSTMTWFVLSALGMGFLGVATGAWWQANHDQAVIRSGHVDVYTWVSVVCASLGLLFVFIAVWLIMRRLGGLKD